MIRFFFALFAVGAYTTFFAAFLYLIAFVGNYPGAPATVDRNITSDVLPALLVNTLLISLFGLQHSIMARQGFKTAWTKIVPAPIERSAYVFLSSAALILMFIFWRPIDGNIWQVENQVGAMILWAVFGFGWLTVLVSTFLINHFELFGLSQVYRLWRGQSAAEPQFRQPFLYRLVRHPIYSGFIIAFWATPVMTYGHLLFAIGMTVYILIGIRYEERDLVSYFGADYESYRGRVGMVAPKISRGS